MKKDFDEIYSNLCENNAEELRKAKSEKDKKTIVIIVVAIIVNIIIAIIDSNKVILAGAIALSGIVAILLTNRETVKFRKLYKKLVIQELVKYYNEKLNYLPEVGVSKYDYSLSKFDTSFDELHSEDGIYGTIGKNTYFRMAQVITKKVTRYKDQNGDMKEEKTTTFNGLYGIVKLETTSNSQIYIANDSITKKYSSKRVEMDSAEFEKQFDCLTGDKMTAMKIFTSDLIEKFVDLKKQNISNFEVKMEEEMLYFRYRSGEFFEPPRLKDILDKEVIRKYYNAISLPIDIIEKIVEKINEL